MKNNVIFINTSRGPVVDETALADAGITQEKANNLSAEMIKIGDTVCYKVQFTGSVTDYRYIIDAKTGLIIGQNFYRTEG